MATGYDLFQKFDMTVFILVDHKRIQKSSVENLIVNARKPMLRDVLRVFTRHHHVTPK